MFKLVLIFAGAGIGGLCRYGVGGIVQSAGTASFPLGTLAVNVLGCLAIGFLAALFAGPVLVREEYRLAIIVGVLGGFTTFSSFGLETMALIEDREWRFVALNLVLSNGLGLLAVLVGSRVSEKLFGV
ncbi:MAG: fluoride efflux transporter CrcB [Planctomycetes bacterium]|nr:fluoride efflux transporter CrcB [Planctomycetota bacterium]NOG55913.1 fluoride efflux transporter CrcB [Planctomycetota bacterium]